MSAPTLKSQAVIRSFAFGDQEQQHSAEGIGCSRAAAVCAPLNPRARDLHQRADQMFASGYEASGWRLREQAWRAEGRG